MAESEDTQSDTPTAAEVQHSGERAFDVPPATLSEEEFLDWAKNGGFGNGKRGTYSNETHFLYIKGCHQVTDEADVATALDIARDLTSHGALHPDTRWGAYKMEGYYQLFPVSPRIEAVSIDDILGTDTEAKLQPGGNGQDSPAVTEWMQRVDPNYQPGQPIQPTSPLRFLNTFEASHPENWGIDTDGTMYPVDTEVIRFPSGLESPIIVPQPGSRDILS